jgi:hypothetical protein
MGRVKQYPIADTIHRDLNGNYRCEFCGLGHYHKAAAVKHVTEKHPDRVAA